MAQYYLINTVNFAGEKRFPGELVDSNVDDVTGMQAAGALLWDASDATVAAAATKAQNARINRGSSEIDMQAIMQSAVDASQKATETSDAASRIQSKTVTITAAMIAAAGAVMSATFNVGTALPTNARLLGCEVSVTTKVQNAGDSDTELLDVGVAGDTEALIKDVNCKTTGFKGDGPAGDATGYVGQLKSAAQLIATLTSSVNLDTITAGSVTVTAFYFVLA